MDRSTGIRDLIHRDISKMGYSEKEMMEEIESAEKIFENSTLESMEEIAGDLEAGQELSDIALETEVMVAEATEF